MRLSHDVDAAQHGGDKFLYGETVRERAYFQQQNPLVEHLQAHVLGASQEAITQ